MGLLVNLITVIRIILTTPINIYEHIPQDVKVLYKNFWKGISTLVQSAAIYSTLSSHGKCYSPWTLRSRTHPMNFNEVSHILVEPSGLLGNLYLFKKVNFHKTSGLLDNLYLFN